MRCFPAMPIAFSLALAAILGCGGSHATGPVTGTVDQTTADDLALQAVVNVDLVGGDAQGAIGGTPTSAARATPVPMPRGASPMRALWDTTYSAGGITYEASRTYYDAANAPLPGYGPLATWLRWTSRAYGTYEGPRDTASVGHAATMDLHGLQAGQDTLKLDGTCADTLQNRFRSYDGTRTRYFYWTAGTSVDDVRFLKSLIQGGNKAPISGTVTFVISADRLRSNNRVDVEAHFDALIIITFNGSSPAVLSVNGRFYYEWNLTTGQVTRI